MKLAEALIVRADAKKRLYQLRERINRSAQVQEGDTTPEDPNALLAEAEQVANEFADLIKRINKTNAQTPFDKARTLSDALADRDILMEKRATLSGAITAATQEKRGYNINIATMRIVRVVDVAVRQQQIDRLARDHRELDARIQQLNWTTELLD